MKRLIVLSVAICVCFVAAHGSFPEGPSRHPKGSALPEKQASPQSESKNIKDPVVARLVAGYQDAVPAERAYCHSLESMRRGDFSAAEADTKVMQEHVRLRKVPLPYVRKLQALLAAKRAAQRQDTLIAFGLLVDRTECLSEWNLFDSKSPTLVGRLRTLSMKDPDPTVRAEAATTLGKWQAASRKWGKS
jgi:hypothetical protein